MDNASQLVLKKQQNRYKMLKAIYEAGSSEYRPVNLYDIGKELGLVREEINDAELYLLGQGLITRFDDQGGIRLMHKGTVEVESSIQHPNNPTEHFSTQVIQPIQNFYGAVGAVQNASHSTANVTQNIGISAPELLNILGELRRRLQNSSLSPEQQTEAIDLVDSIEEETKSPTPKPSRLKAFMMSLTQIAVEAGVTTGVKEILDKLPALLGVGS